MTIKMEEVDGIIVHTLRSIGCDVEDDVQSLAQFSTELIVEATARCIKVINNELEVPHRLPPSMSAKFRVGTSLATVVQTLGYRGEIGYQTFLYSNEAEIRRVFMFLIEKLPKEASDAAEESVGASVLLQRTIASEISRRLSSPWTPSYCKSNGICWRGKPPQWSREGCKNVQNFKACSLNAPSGLHDVTRKVPRATKAYYNKSMPIVSCQPVHHEQVAASVLEENTLACAQQQEWENEWNSMGLASRLTPEEYKARKRERINNRIAESIRASVKQAEVTMNASQDLNQLIASMGKNDSLSGKSKGSRFTHIEKLQFKDDEKTSSQIGAEVPQANTEEELQNKREEEVKALRDELTQLINQFDKLDMEMKKFSGSNQQMREMIEQISHSNKEKEDAYRVKKRTLDLLPDAENNIAKLQEMVETSSQRLLTLANQWEKHRVPLIEQYREMKTLTENRVSETQKKLDEIKELREKMKGVAGEAREKDELYKQLVTEYESITKDVNRSAYTRRIMEIISNIKKQKDQIDKVLIDTKAIQKEINQLSGKLDRTFTVTDEIIFRDAKKDESVRKAYKYLASLHENCSLLITTVEETGVIMREIRDLEDQIEQESKKKILSNLEKITDDHSQMRKENQVMMQKLKRQSQS